MNVVLSARNAEGEKGIHGLFGLDRLPVHIDCPALVIGDARKEQRRPLRLDLCVDCVVRITVYLHPVLQHGLPEFFQCVEIKAVHDDRGLGLIVGNLRKVQNFARLPVAEFHQIAAFQIVEGLVFVIRRELDLICLRIGRKGKVKAVLLHGHALLTAVRLGVVRNQHRRRIEQVAEIVLHIGGILKSSAPAVREVVLCHKPERQRVRIFDKHGRAGTSCLFLALVVLFVRDKAVPDIQQRIDERCGSGDRIGIDRSLAADRAQEVRERLIGGRAKERDGVEVQESAVVLTLPLVLFEAHKRRLGNRFFQQPNIRIVRGVFGAARRRYARIGEI